MASEISATEAQYALSSIDRQRQQVIAEIDVPWWYWVSVAAGWVALGVLAQYGPTWAIIAGTLAFGAAALGHCPMGPFRSARIDLAEHSS